MEKILAIIKKYHDNGCADDDEFAKGAMEELLDKDIDGYWEVARELLDFLRTNGYSDEWIAAVFFTNYLMGRMRGIQEADAALEQMPPNQMGQS